MSALLLPALAAGSSGQGALYVGDVFSAYIYTGNGSAQTINNGIDLAGKGGLAWVKSRTNTENHFLFDTVRGALSELNSNNTEAQTSLTNSLTAFNSSGFSVGSAANTVNTNAQNYVSWAFRKAAKFFDVVTYTGNGAADRRIAHSLGIDPGMVIIKRADATGNWCAMARRGANAYACGLFLDTTGLQQGSSHGITADSYKNTIAIEDVPNGGSAYTQAQAISMVNALGGTYVAYLFAHDPSAGGIIQCGSFTTDSSGNATVNLGWANGSQFAMIKAASIARDWEMYDTARTSAWSGNDARLRANLSSAEDSVARISASGTSIIFAGLSANSTYIYMAIRSPS